MTTPVYGTDMVSSCPAGKLILQPLLAIFSRIAIWTSGLGSRSDPTDILGQMACTILSDRLSLSLWLALITHPSRSQPGEK